MQAPKLSHGAMSEAHDDLADNNQTLSYCILKLESHDFAGLHVEGAFVDSSSASETSPSSGYLYVCSASKD